MKQRKVRRKRKTEIVAARQTSLMFWNGRGILDKVADIHLFLEERSIAIAGLTETRVCEENLSAGKWKWISGRVTIPSLDEDSATRGIGVFYDTSIVPGTKEVRRGKYTLWVRVPGACQRDLYVCVAYVPVYSTSTAERTAAWAELREGLDLFRGLGEIVIGGDFDSRCAMNGDVVCNTSGRQLLSFCGEEMVIKRGG